MIKVYFYHGQYSEKKLPSSIASGNSLSLLFPRRRASGLAAVHDGAILSLVLHEFQKHFVFLVIKSAQENKFQQNLRF